jgi:hypothetical protein
MLIGSLGRELLGDALRPDGVQRAVGVALPGNPVVLRERLVTLRVEPPGT